MMTRGTPILGNPHMFKINIQKKTIDKSPRLPPARGADLSAIAAPAAWRFANFVASLRSAKMNTAGKPSQQFPRKARDTFHPNLFRFESLLISF